jgi:DNA helicase-2/ATP-dependent DNA helicase PcrA
MEEERGLAFVAMTRAQKRLFISEAGGQNFEGIPRYPSRFIMDIDEKLLEFTEKPSDEMMSAVRKFIANDSKHLKGAIKLNLLEKGERVQHAILGPGTILDIDMESESYLIKFDGMETPRQISFKINLKKVEE